MIIRDNNGRTLGTIEHDASERERIDARTRELLAGARSKAQRDDTPARPFFPRVRATLDAMTRAGRVATLAAFAIIALAMIGAVMPDDATATPTPAPVAPVSVPLDVREASAVLTPERVAPFNGSTRADAASGWNGASIDRNGDVRVSGHVVDNVNVTGSPLRAQYLAAFDRNGLPRGNESTTVREGVTFCADVRNGEVSALREASDARADAPTFGTGHRRMIVASAALVNFCPQFA
ncbi:hypothetical protein SEA_MASELOP_87 [Rhodococcus phage Maselop]|nr:hypothetical protein SEA_MASELOP_87 [Rhodococcus phage Maselop]WNM67470.1 hypothetical protein SEA_POLYYUKI_86 [Rhodococcus phage Polyyuki]